MIYTQFQVYHVEPCDALFYSYFIGSYPQILGKSHIHSNFQIAVVVDMWITGFDVPSLSVMYIDKPLKKHTLVQTISRVNRVFEGKDKGLVVDYIGFKQDMMEAVKQYGDKNENPVDELKISLDIFRNHLSLIDDLFCKFNSKVFFEGTPMEKLNCLNEAAEYIQGSQDMQLRFMGLSKRLKSAYMICYPSGELTDIETEKAQFYMAVRSIIYKQTKGHVPDAEMMNRVVESMVQRAVSCTGVEDIVNENKSVDLFSEEFLETYSNKLEIIDIMFLVRQTLALTEEIRFLCKPDCRGICPMCGQDLNVASCNCKPVNLSPFAVLKGKFK